MYFYWVLIGLTGFYFLMCVWIYYQRKRAKKEEREEAAKLEERLRKLIYIDQKDHERIVLAKAIMRVFDEWDLPNTDRQALLGLGSDSLAVPGRYAEGQPLSNTRDLLDRVGHLLGIYKGLRLLYPENPEVRSGWLSSPDRRFGGKTPVEVIREHGFAGLLMVRGQIDKMLCH